MSSCAVITIDKLFNPAICYRISFLKKSQKINVLNTELDCFEIYSLRYINHQSCISIQTISHTTTYIFWFYFEKRILIKWQRWRDCHSKTLRFSFSSFQHKFMNKTERNVRSKANFIKTTHFLKSEKWCSSDNIEILYHFCTFLTTIVYVSYSLTSMKYLLWHQITTVRKRISTHLLPKHLYIKYNAHKVAQ